ERFADTWALQILPGYVFTTDGQYNFLAGERGNVLSTKRASRDYNSKVHVDLVFWTWILSHGQQGNFPLRMYPSHSDLEKMLELGDDNPKVESLLKSDYLKAFHENVPFLIKSSLPTFTLHNLEEGIEEAEDLTEKAELAEIEDEIAGLAEEFEEDFE